jgi:hypothetical protein
MTGGGIWRIQPIPSWCGLCGLEDRKGRRMGGLIWRNGLLKKRASETRFGIKFTPINIEVVRPRCLYGMR